MTQKHNHLFVGAVLLEQLHHKSKVNKASCFLDKKYACNSLEMAEKLFQKNIAAKRTTHFDVINDNGSRVFVYYERQSNSIVMAVVFAWSETATRHCSALICEIIDEFNKYEFKKMNKKLDTLVVQKIFSYVI